MADNEALFAPELVFFDWECATPDEVFARLEGELVPRGYIADGWFDAVRTREDAYPTGLAMPAANIAIPHTDPGFVQALMNIFMDADAAADVLGQTTSQGMVDAIRRHF